MMTKRRLLLLTALTACMSRDVMSVSPAETITDEEFAKCGLWFSMSSTSTDSEPKFALYAGRDFEVNETVGLPDIGIPFFDWIEDWNRYSHIQDRTFDIWEGYLWTPEFAGAQFETEHSATVLVPGLGVLANYHTGFNNVDFEQGSVLLREGSTFSAGKNHVARGAITPYSNLTMKAIKQIKAGMEIFGNYGDVWDGNHTEDVYQDKLTRWDYEDADRVLDKILEFMNKYDDQLNSTQKDHILDFIMGRILGTAAGSHAKVIRSLIPSHPGKLQVVKDMGGTFAYRNPDLVKTKKWLKKHAVCADNLIAKPSTVPDAGRGAFAARDLRRGSVIAPMPMLHMADREVLQRYAVDDSNQDKPQLLFNRKIGTQLILNYGFSHPESSMLLVPVSGVVNMVNHAPVPKANAAIRWAADTKSWGNDNSMFDVRPENLLEEEHIRLVMELYALRDIPEGDEVFIDYQSDWSEAWNAHETKYKERAISEWPIKAEDLKAEYKDKPFKTIAQQDEGEAYPDGITTACFVETETMTDGMPKLNEHGEEIALWDGPLEFGDYKGSSMFYCEVIEVSEKLGDGNMYNYTVRATSGKTRVQVMNVPHRSITFVDKPYTSDLHKRGSFRHYIGIPDHIFPPAWRNKI